MAYTADLITVLKSLFANVTQPSSSEAPKVTKQAVTDEYQIHKTSAIRRNIYRRINAEFPNRARDLLYLQRFFHPLLLHLLGFDLVPLPDSGNMGRVASSSTGPGVASSSRPRPTEIPIPSPDTQVAQPQPSSTVIPPNSVEESMPEPRVASSSRPRPTEIPIPSPDTQVAQPPPNSTVIPPNSVEESAPEPGLNVWSRFIGCLTNPC